MGYSHNYSSSPGLSTAMMMMMMLILSYRFTFLKRLLLLVEGNELNYVQNYVVVRHCTNTSGTATTVASS